MGERISVYWKRAREWFHGTVSSVDLRIGKKSKTGYELRVDYDDGEGNESVHLLPPCGDTVVRFTDVPPPPEGVVQRATPEPDVASESNSLKSAAATAKAASAARGAQAAAEKKAKAEAAAVAGS